MLRKKFQLSFLTILIFFTSCGQLKPIPQPLPSPSGNWTVKLNQSGGIAGVLLTVDISSNGQLNAEDQRSLRSVTQTLPAQTITKLNQMVSGISMSPRSFPPSGCADCFIYNLEIQSEAANVHLSVDDVTMKDSSAVDLIAYVITLRDDALHSKP
jgi:hypothetical protein